MSPHDDPNDVESQTEPSKSSRRYVAGMVIYGGLAVLAGLTLDGAIRIATWIFLAGLALKTWIAALKDRSG
jgi:hypothetical protein